MSNQIHQTIGVLAACFFFTLAGCDVEDPDQFSFSRVSMESEPVAPASDAAIKAFCGGCHVMPSPSSFGRERWYKEVVQGFRLYGKSGRDDLVRPDFDATLAYFQDKAPDGWVFEPIESTPDELFEEAEVAWKGERKPVQVSHVTVDRAPDKSLQIAMADMWTGNLFRTKLNDGELQSTVVGSVSHPAQMHGADLNRDGIQDYIVADLGTYRPHDSQQSSVWFLQGTETGEFRRSPIRLGLLRTAGVQSLDHDGDGDLDLIVSDFGRLFDGAIYLLTNQGNQEDGVPQYKWKTMDARAGAIETPVADLNGDGKPDVITLVSQHYETVEAHLNLGDGEFETRVIYQAEDPSYGSSGIEVVDLDRDGDLDVVYTNGDTFDDSFAKPFHCIRWFENEGKFPFTQHRITTMPGVYCAVTGDIDMDGDLDIAAVALLEDKEVARYPSGTFDGVIWLEQTENKNFIRHTILRDKCHAATCNLYDWDGDGDLELFVPPYRWGQKPSDRVSVYWNQTK